MKKLVQAKQGDQTTGATSDPEEFQAVEQQEKIRRNNEQDFKSLFENTYTGTKLGKKLVYPVTDKKRQRDKDVEISVDISLEHQSVQLLIEIDSGNMAKLIAGQYCLLHTLMTPEERERSLFVVVHYYRDKNGKLYAPERTKKNLDLLNQEMYEGKGLRYRIFNEEGIKRLFAQAPRVEQLVRQLLVDPTKPYIEFNGEKMNVPPKVAAVLKLLGDKRGQTVSKNQLKTAMNSDETSVNPTISTARKLLNDVGATNAFRTVTGQGYEWDSECNVKIVIPE